MKKVLSLTIAVLFVMVAASAVFAADTTFEGQYRVQAWSEWNFDKQWNDKNDSQFDGWFEQRFRLTITHTRSEYLKAVVQIDLVEDTWGQGRAMYINNSNNGEYINWAYLDFTLPSIGHFRVGKFPVTWGHAMTFSREHPGHDGLEWSNAWGPVSLTLLYSKRVDKVITAGPTSGTYNQDGNMFAARIAYTPMENHLIELFGAYYNNGDYTFTDSAWGVTVNNIDLNVGFVALAYTGNFADMIDVKFEGSYIFGNGDHAAWGDIDISGWNIYLDVSYYNDLWRIGLAFLMKSGNDDFFLRDNNLNICTFGDENFAWSNIVAGNGGSLNSVYSGPLFGGNNGIENVTSVKLYFEICPMEKLTINAAVLWAKFTEDVGTNSWYWHPAEYYGHYGNYEIVNDSELGWEIDLGFSYEIMEGLTYTFAGGVLFTGDAFDYSNASGVRDNWGAIWSISNTLMYEF